MVCMKMMIVVVLFVLLLLLVLLFFFVCGDESLVLIGVEGEVCIMFILLVLFIVWVGYLIMGVICF